MILNLANSKCVHRPSETLGKPQLSGPKGLHMCQGFSGIDSNKCCHALCSTYTVVIPVIIAGSVLWELGIQNENLSWKLLKYPVCFHPFTTEENTSYGWKASLELRLLYLREAFSLCFLLFPCKNPDSVQFLNGTVLWGPMKKAVCRNC